MLPRAALKLPNRVQFKVQQEDETVCLFVRKNADAEWVRADKRLIQMIDEAMPREDTPTPTPQPTPAATPVPTPAPTPVIAPRKVQTLPQTRRWFPAAGYRGRFPCVCDRYRAADR